ncbi:hypothetical protein [Litorisediminicola beolgyonensis]|uniref:Secreted protein n=1 Tax=Litorisediminicola beolgyonensis TaxID=1173614 RepID=A0ABW3ZM74_9RHOB
MRLAPLLLLLTSTALGAAAETPMTAAEFDAYVTGKTLFFGSGGQAYGAEEYKPDRRVIWSFLDGDCREGEWYPSGEQICFTYVHDPDPQCWSFYRAPGGLRAVFENDPTRTVLYEARQSAEPMWCLGPEVGV